MKTIITSLTWLIWILCLAILLFIFLLAFLNPEKTFTDYRQIADKKKIVVNDLLSSAYKTARDLQANPSDEHLHAALKTIRNQLVENQSQIPL